MPPADTDSVPALRQVVLFPPGRRTLAVGEGDFAFSEGLVAARQRLGPVDLVATSLDSEEEVIACYAGAAARLARLREAGAELHFGVDASCLSISLFAGQPFDRVVFNFPLLPARTNSSRSAGVDMIIANRRLLVSFLDGATALLKPGGLVVITSKDCYPYSWWRIEALHEFTTRGSLRHLEELPWKCTDYPHLYNGPCNVNRDAAVKPTEAVAFVFTQRIHHLFSNCRSRSRDEASDWGGNSRSGSGEPLSGRFGLHRCGICRVGGLTSAQDLAAHEAGKIHQKRLELEHRWDCQHAQHRWDAQHAQQ